MRIALLGANGQLARDLAPLLPGEVLPVTRAELDLHHLSEIAPKLTALQANVVINCSAYNFVDKAETEPEVAFQVNAWAVRELAKACETLGAYFVQISSDYVFGLDTHLRRPLTETDPAGPVSVYGVSKLNGELFARMYCTRHLVVRTCGLYGVWGSGGKGGNFIETMLRVAGQGKPLKVVNDQHCTPTSTRDLAQGIVQLMKQEAVGVFHLTSAGETTWHDLAAEAFRQAGVTANLSPTTSEAFGAPAKRPPYSVLNCDKAAKLGVLLPEWQDAVGRYLEERKKK